MPATKLADLLRLDGWIPSAVVLSFVMIAVVGVAIAGRPAPSGGSAVTAPPITAPPPTSTPTSAATPTATSSQTPSPVPEPSSAEPTDGPTLVVAGVTGFDKSPLRAHLRLSLVRPLAGGALITTEIRELDFQPDEVEGLATEVVPSSSGSMLVRVRGVAAWLWEPGRRPQPASLPKALLTSASLRWSPDGRWLAGLSSREATIVLWESWSGQTQRIPIVFSPDLVTAAERMLYGVVGWIGDQTGFIVARVPPPSLRCTWPGWLAVVDYQTGVLHQFPDSYPPSTGSVPKAGLEISLANRQGALVDAEGQLRVGQNCADLTGGEPVALPNVQSAYDATWSTNGARLSVLAGLDDGSRTLVTFANGAQPPILYSEDVTSGATSIEALDAPSRWFVVRHRAEQTCSLPSVLDAATGQMWSLPCSTWLNDIVPLPEP